MTLGVGNFTHTHPLAPSVFAPFFKERGKVACRLRGEYVFFRMQIFFLTNIRNTIWISNLFNLPIQSVIKPK